MSPSDENPRPGACALAAVANAKIDAHIVEGRKRHEEVLSRVGELAKLITRINDKFEGRWWTIMMSVTGTLITVIIALLIYLYRTNGQPNG